MTPRTVVIDTDPGKDDAVALLLALASPELRVHAIAAVHGNVPLALTERNARRILALAGRPGIPVHPGCPRPLLVPPIGAAHVHGDTGLGTLDLPDPTVPPRPEHAVAHLVHTVATEPPGSVTLCLLGPATNLAVALIQSPGIAARLGPVVMMAGAHHAHGNITPCAEFNAYADPHAARIVMEAGLDLTLVPLDLTHQLRLTAPRLARLRTIGTTAATALAHLFQDDEDPPMHDPCVIAHLLQPTLFQGRPVHVQTETTSDLTRGMTVLDPKAPPNATWLDTADPDPFFTLLFDRLSNLP